MLTKILFTIVVIAGVAIFYRQKAEKENAKRQTPATPDQGSVPPKTMAYIIIGVLLAASAVVFFLNWQTANEVVNIRVTSESGEVVIYQAYQKDIKGRSFTSLTGSQITLGESDRFERYTD